MSVLLAGGVVFNLYEKSGRSVSPALLLSITEVPPGAFAGSPPKNQTPVFAPVDLNQAGADELERLPGLGPALAERILEYREKNGGYKSVRELLRVPGIGPKKLAQIQPKVYVSQKRTSPPDGIGSAGVPQIFPGRPAHISPESSSLFQPAEGQ